MAVPTGRKMITTAEYELMVEEGILSEEDRVELLEGEIVEMSPIGWAHSFCVNRLISIFSAYLGQSLLIWSQSPIRLTDNSEPQPDFALIKSRPDLSPASPPTAVDVILLVEVADSSLDKDRGRKLRLYAKDGTTDYWIVNIPDGIIEVYSKPMAGKYGKSHIAKRGETLPLPAGLTGTVKVDDILGKIDIRP